MSKKIKWAYNIGQNILDKEKNFVILDRKSIENKQYYKIQCNRCGFDGNKKHIKLKNNPKRIISNEHWIEKFNLDKMNSCPCCGDKVSVICFGINDLATTHPHLIKYFKGGKEEAKLYHSTSKEMVDLFCPDCKTDISNIMIRYFTKRKHFCTNCGNGGYYPNKLMFNILKQFDIQFETEFSPDWIDRKRYDFYIPQFNIIIEMDGGLGHGNKIHKKSKMTIDESIRIDKYKDEQANLHGIAVIRIDCCKSEFEYIKNNILKSELSNYFNFDNINWNTVRYNLITPIMLSACNMYNAGIIDPRIIAKETGMKPSSIRYYLHEGTELGICNYDSNKLRKLNSYENSGSFKSRKIILLNTLEVFNSQNNAKENYNATNISQCCNGTRDYAGTHPITFEPLVWAYYDDYLNMTEEDIKRKLNIKLSKGKNVPIICIQTKEIFKSFRDAARKHSLKTATWIKKCCECEKDFYGELQDGTKLQWMYYSDYKKLFSESQNNNSLLLCSNL